LERDAILKVAPPARRALLVEVTAEDPVPGQPGFCAQKVVLPAERGRGLRVLVRALKRLGYRNIRTALIGELAALPGVHHER